LYQSHGHVVLAHLELFAKAGGAIAVGSLTFAEKIKSDFGTKGIHGEVEQADGMYVLRESSDAYNGEFAQKTEALRPENTIPWQNFSETAET
jgi:hypothetical protein